MPIAESELRIGFFDILFGNTEGWLCIAHAPNGRKRSGFTQSFFRWPLEATKLESFILNTARNSDMWFCVNLLEKRERKKEWCLPTDLIWADLDECDPKDVSPPPPILMSSSPGRFQALWRLSTTVDPALAENYSKRVAYAHAKNGADTTGWDLTQLLRVPFTTNYKYAEKPLVQLLQAIETKAPLIIFETLPPLPIAEKDTWDVELPDVSDYPTAEVIVYKYAATLRGTAFKSIFTTELAPEDDWSKLLWRLIHLCLEAGMTGEETFVVTKESPINKYDRDNRPLKHLWRDILKAADSQGKITSITALQALTFKPLVMPELVPADSYNGNEIIDLYREWAGEATDAVAQFHDLCIFMVLSAIVANSVRLDMSHGQMVPNLWGLVLGDSTLTRKTTAMQMAMEFIKVIDREMVLATDGSAEGLISGLATRPNKTSIFFKDEVSGFFDSINRKDYLAGMPETLTNLYDVPPFFTRRLRKETIIIENPIFIFFGGGVRDKVFQNVTEDYVYSGFLPRFLVVSGETDLSKLRRTGPPSITGIEKKKKLMNHIANLYEIYCADILMDIGGQKVQMPARIEAKLTKDAWNFYGDIEWRMVNEGNDSSVPGLALPTFERLSRSMLKMSLILAATRQHPIDNTITVTKQDIMNAAWFVQQWGHNSVDLILNAGKGAAEKVMEKILAVISRNPGILRSTIMQHYHLNKREADDILFTLEDRQLVVKRIQGRGHAYWTN